jgi:hypothetical protein
MPTLRLTTRWKLRAAIRIVNETLNILRIDKHPGKTFIGKVERGFNFLGYFLKPGILRVAWETLQRFTQRISQLYEQGAEVGSVRADEDRIGEYVRHWLRWVWAGVALQLKPFKVWGHRKKSTSYCQLFVRLKFIYNRYAN